MAKTDRAALKEALNQRQDDKNLDFGQLSWFEISSSCPPLSQSQWIENLGLGRIIGEPLADTKPKNDCSNRKFLTPLFATTLLTNRVTYILNLHHYACY